MALRLASSSVLSISSASSGSSFVTASSRCLPSLLQSSTLLRRSTVADVGLRFHHQQHCQHRQQHSQRSQWVKLTGSASSSTSFSRSLSTASSSESAATSVLATYQGPLHTTFRRLKVFSLSSLVFAGVLTPYLLLGPGSLDTFARVALVITALSASGASTALISWIGKPYVAKLELVKAGSPSAAAKQESGSTDPLPPSSTHLVAHTTSWRLQPLSTTIYQPGYIRGTSRPFAQWQLAADPPALPVESPPQTSAKLRSLIAETRLTKTGAVVGQYWVEWRPDALTRAPVIPQQSQDGETEEAAAATQPQWRMEGVCKIEGKPVRHYNVHEELLNDDWRVLE